jgi:hypothetical protein
MNILVFAVLFAQILLQSNIFFSVGKGVNIIAHEVSFLLGLFVSLPWYFLFGKLSILEWNKPARDSKPIYENSILVCL